MKYAGILQEKNPGSRIMYSLVFILLGIFIFGIVGAAIIFLINPDHAMDMVVVSGDLSDPTKVLGLKILQLFSSIGTFVFPGVMAGWLFSQTSVQDYLRLYRVSSVQLILFSIFIMASSLPIINWIGYWNSQLSLPESIQFIEDWMRSTENNNQQILEVFLKMDSPLDYLFNLLLIAVVPAIGEEFLFRGVFQRELNVWWKNHHLAIWVSAFVFSAIHMQFLGFVPRLLMGALFGYVFYWSGSLILPILMHFINNALALSLVYFTNLKVVPEETEDLGIAANQWPLITICSLVVVFLLYRVYVICQQKKEAS